MQERIEVVYEQGMLRPLEPLPEGLRERQHFTVTIETAVGANDWLAAANPAVSLESVRRGLASIPGSLARQVQAEREEP
jgi:predicted DNA-binding antitoxin AbrB/MazE fold protein